MKRTTASLIFILRDYLSQKTFAKRSSIQKLDANKISYRGKFIKLITFALLVNYKTIHIT